jgi:tryptophan-rich sensory protein
MDYFVRVLTSLLPFTILAGSQVFPATKNAGAAIPERPNGWVFGVAWTLLALLMAITMYMLRPIGTYIPEWIMMILLIIGAWVWMYLWNNGNRKDALAVLIGMVMLIVALLLFLPTSSTKALMSPWLVWLLVATYLNMRSLIVQE